jgi:outer membrane receptor protein involved in Fe transport
MMWVSVGLLTTALSARVAHPQSIRIAAAAPPSTIASTRVTLDLDHVPLRTVIGLIAQQASLSPIYEARVVPSNIRVTLHVKNATIATAFEAALHGTGLIAQLQSSGVVSILPTTSASIVAGIIVGRVTDAKTKHALPSVRIVVDGQERGRTSADGMYRVTAVERGTHVVIVKLIGYKQVTRSVVIDSDTIITVNVALDPSTIALDQVVVTGTVIATELRAVPNAITVITAKQLEERGITHIDQLFRGDVPGLFAMNRGANTPLDQVLMFSRGATALSSASAGTKGWNTNPIKTYVDGVEMADAQYLSQIDPRSIERIEILTGSQASTIYGSNALNGVMQIFTKRGTSSKPQLTLNLLSGWVENNFSTARTPQHDYSALVNGIDGKVSYNAGGSWNYVGAWTPAKQTTRVNVFGGTRLEFPTSVGRITADVTLRRDNTQNVEGGAPNQSLTHYQSIGLYAPSQYSPAGLSQPTTYTLSSQALGLELGFAPTHWWSHTVNVGQDASDTERKTTARGYLSARDTTLQLQQTHVDRRSLRYTTTAQAPVTSLVQATVTLGVDGWQSLTTSLDATPQTLTGSLVGTISAARRSDHNAGAFLQTQFGVGDQLFFTYGLRAEWNPSFGEEVQPNYAPRCGVAYTHELGAATVKLRASYGRSTRPPAPGLRAGQTIAEFWAANSCASCGDYIVARYGNFDYNLANPELAPEHQQGGEGGLEFYWGTRMSLVVTRYNQTVDGLIDSPIMDSVRSLVPTEDGQSTDADGYSYQLQTQAVNVGSIRNQGWELQGSVQTGPVTTRGTYSWTKSRTMGVNPKYRSFFTQSYYPQYQPGATFQYLPEHTWAVAMMYARAQTTLGINLTGVGQIRNINNDFFNKNLNSNYMRLRSNLYSYNAARTYVNFNNGYALADLNATQRFSSRIEGVLQVQNLTDYYKNDFWAEYATMGRQVKGGVRVHM